MTINNKEDLLARLVTASAAVSEWEASRDLDDPSWDLNSAIVAYLGTASDEEFLGAFQRGLIPASNRTSYGSLISLVAQQNRPALIASLIAANCDVLTKDFDDLTPLERTIAYLEGPSGAGPVLALIAAGAKTSEFLTPLSYAASLGKAYIVDALIKTGHNPNEHCEAIGMPPLAAAVTSVNWPDCISTVRTLLAAGATCQHYGGPLATTPDGVSAAADAAIFWLAEAGNEPAPVIEAVLDMLVEYGASIEATNDPSGSLSTCVDRHAETLAIAILKRSKQTALSNGRGEFSATIFQRAAISGMSQLVAYMLEHHHEDPTQHYAGRSLADHITHEGTRAVLLAAAAQESIATALNHPVDPEPPAARRRPAPLL